MPWPPDWRCGSETAQVKDINLIPPQYFVRRATIRHATGWGLALAVIVAAVGGTAFWQHGRLRTARRALENQTRSAELVAPLREQLKALAVERTRLEGDLDRISSLLHRKYRSGLLAHIANSVNDDIVLTELVFQTPRQASREAAGTGPVSRRNAAASPAQAPQAAQTPGSKHCTLILKGYALSEVEFTRFVTSLREGTLMPDVRLEFVQQAEERYPGLKTFELRCTVSDEEEAYEPAQG